MTSAAQRLDEVAASLLPAGLDTVELLFKEGRSRKASVGPEGQLVSRHREQGWAVRACGERTSLFCCGAGELAAGRDWPSPVAGSLKLPGPRPVTRWQAPAGLDSSLVVEHEALDILDACARGMARELPGSQLLRAALEDGTSRWSIASTRGIEGEVPQRAATLLLEAAIDGARVVDLQGARTAKDFDPDALARRLSDRLTIRREGRRGGRGRGLFLLAPSVAIRCLASLLPLLMARGARPAWAAAEGAQLGSGKLTIVDDGRLSGGLFSAAIDGEGSPTGRTVLMERGVLGPPLGSSRSNATGTGRGFGCVRRPSYRDVPAIGPSHLFVEPDPDRPAASLLEEMGRGHYLVEPQDAGRFDLEADRFHLTVGGFAVRDGRPTAAITGASLSGSISGLLAGVRAVARDLAWTPVAGLMGSPSLLVSDLDLNAS